MEPFAIEPMLGTYFNWFIQLLAPHNNIRDQFMQLDS